MCLRRSRPLRLAPGRLQRARHLRRVPKDGQPFKLDHRIGTATLIFLIIFLTLTSYWLFTCDVYPTSSAREPEQGLLVPHVHHQWGLRIRELYARKHSTCMHMERFWGPKIVLRISLAPLHLPFGGLYFAPICDGC